MYHAKRLDAQFSNELNKAYRPLNVDEEKEAIIRAKKGDLKAKHLLANSQIKFIIDVARSYADDENTAEYLVGEGLMGAMHAVDQFDLTLELRFYTYARWWIRSFILRSLENNRLIKTPRSKKDKDLMAAAKELRNNGKFEEAESLLRSNISTPKASYASMDHSTDEKDSMHHYFASKEDLERESAIKADFKKLMDRMPQGLDRAIIIMHYVGDMTLSEIGGHLGGVSKQTVSIRLNEAMDNAYKYLVKAK